MKKFLAIVLALCLVVALAVPAYAADKTLKVWVADAVVDFTKEQIDAFMAEHPEYADYAVTVEPVGEGDAASNVLTDLDAAADIFGFPQDQLARLVAAGALIELSEENAAVVAEENSAGSVAAATMGDLVYAYPLTADNGYFLYYDKSVVTDPSSLEAIVADCEAAGKGFYMEINSGYYMPAFFFGAGCTLTYDADDTGAFTACNIDYASDAGVGALKAIIKLAQSPAFHNGSSIGNATNVGAIVDGTWDANAAKELLGENYACAKLPTFDCEGTPTQMSGFAGFKLLGVKPQTDDEKLALCDELALFLASGEVQVARYNAAGWGPSNLAAQADPAVQADEALSAYAAQGAFTIPQGQYPGDYWSLATALGDSVIAGDYNSADDAALLAVLQNFQDTCIGYAK
ncbi:MAG: extracellular solute-binding protein [Eubacteriales bacterium]|nr:extracellular solute-binding protein [Eubacteriales bacterium]